MKQKQPGNRRQFLKNLALTAGGAALLPGVTAAQTAGSQEVDACIPATLDYYGEGPFYTANPPALVNGQLADVNEPGTRMIISGRVFNLDCTEVLPDTLIDVWHADNAGQYDNVGLNLRGTVQSNNQGFYLFETIQPGKYLNGGQFRPSHIHFKITPPGFSTLITQLYFQGDLSIPNDAAASISSGTYDASNRIIPLNMNNGKLEGTWDIVVDGSGVVGQSELHLDKGMIYSAGPNPFTDHLNIFYGVFRESKVSLMVYDLQGRKVAQLEEQILRPEKYTAVWRPDSTLPKGHYFVALKINDLQVHYLKIIRQ